MTNGSTNTRIDRKNLIKLLVFAGLTLVLIVFSQTAWVRQNFSIDNLTAIHNAVAGIAQRPYGPLLFCAASAVFLILYLPAMVTLVITGIVYGFWEAFLIAWIGNLIGASATFLISRFLLEEFFKPRLKQSALNSLLVRLEKDGLFTMVFLRLLFFLFPPFNWAIGATGVRFKDYVAGTAAGIIPWLAAILVAVRKLSTIQSARDLLQPESLAMAGAFAVLFIAVMVLRNKFVQPGEKEKEKDHS